MTPRHQWSVPVNAELDHLVRDTAERAGVDLSYWIRQVVTRAVEETADPRKKIVVVTSPEEFKSFQARAEELGLSLVDYLRLLGRRDSGMRTL